ncbi:hypothetical protein FUA48_06755 [Flavobacterium alkalisoli]|uniref:Uncharacterized protein n=2 Tax=Flavobacterium TaxID=237 RepID=A0A444WCA7_9FLAO|nr:MULTISPECIES: hypothetical protein [Flavobacterium]QEE49289.1 hypothetical protein FUA48_06755 [Flavobacterium alkalisoli]RYJ43439.1 hypothetical protein NU09_1777 [Flavobacterium beibuense]
MKSKIAHFIGGIIIYFPLAVLLVFIDGWDDFQNKWRFMISFTLSMTLCEMFILSKIREGKWFKKKSNTH